MGDGVGVAGELLGAVVNFMTEFGFAVSSLK
jgi:hypothetical protein